MIDQKAFELYMDLKNKGLIDPSMDKAIMEELSSGLSHSFISLPPYKNYFLPSFYNMSDINTLMKRRSPIFNASVALKSLDDLLKRDKEREEDGFPKKIRLGKMIRPVKGGKDRFVVVPTVEEEKFYHDNSVTEDGEDDGTGGTGGEKEGEIIGEMPLHQHGPGQGGPGQGEGGEHDISSNAYDLGKVMKDKFKLPDLKDKGKKKAVNKWVYDLTDRKKGAGQLLDTRATIFEIIKTNLSLENIDIDDIDITKFIVSPDDSVYRVLSRERDFESQAVVFFIRDYSGSMQGPRTDVVVHQHVLIHAWLTYQYDKLVKSRFILHDTEAKEVPDFYTYYNLQVSGGTMIASAYQLVNKIIREENLAKDYNIYIFHGTDGDDWDNDGSKAIPQLEEMISYSNRIGITIANNVNTKTTLQGYLEGSKLFSRFPNKIKINYLNEGSSEEQIIEGIKKLLS